MGKQTFEKAKLTNEQSANGFSKWSTFDQLVGDCERSESEKIL
jgi:hypothetical protein